MLIRAKEQEGEEKPPAPPEWHEHVSIGDTHTTGRDRILEFLEPFQEMSDGHLGTIRSVKHRIETKPGSKPCFNLLIVPVKLLGHKRKKRSTKCSKWE